MGASFEKIKLFILAVIIGTASFVLIYGTTPLHAANDRWIMAAIGEDDIVQHYAGWTMYRTGSWTYPLGMISEMARGTGTTTVYTDSIPWVALFFKILFGITGFRGAFQYFGLFTLTCFILQAYAAGLLMRRKSESLIYAAFAMLIFCFAPPLLDRTLRHTALGAQFIVLFAMLTYFKCRDGGYTRFPTEYIVLAALSVGIHSYFLPMVMIFSLLTMMEGIIKNHKLLPWIGQFFASCAAAVLSALLLGVFVSSGDVSRSDYGHYNMNLLALVNPEGGTGYTWSKTLPMLGHTGGNYEGFNYAGFGIILLGVSLLILAFFGRFLKTDWFPAYDERKHIGYLCIMIFLTAFAVSNVVTFGDKVIFTMPLPGKITELCGIFRSSGRLFYPVFYSIYVLLLYRLWDFASKNGLKTRYGRPCPFVLPIAAIAVTAVLQIADLGDVIMQKHEDMREAAFAASLIDDPVVCKMADECDFVVSLDKHRDVCVLAGLHGMGTSFSAATGGTWDEAYKLRDSRIEDLRHGMNDGRTMLVTDSWTMASDITEANPNMMMYQYDDRYFVGPAQ